MEAAGEVVVVAGGSQELMPKQSNGVSHSPTDGMMN